MFTALISAAFGALNALLPDVVGFFKKKQEMEERAAERTHELLLIDKQVEAQIRIGQQKMDEIRTAGDIELTRTEIAGQFEQMKDIYRQQAATGIQWVDAWNAVMRPAACTAVLLIFTMGVAIYEASVIARWWQGTILAEDIMLHMFNGIVGETILACWGYLFGYRGTNAARRYSQS